jgi:hypothetical protein
MDRDLLVTLKALSDASRLRIVGLLASRPYAVEELADDLRLAPGTVVHHLKRLSAAGLVEARPRRPYVEYSLKVDRLQSVGRMLDEMERAIRSFIVDGRLTSIPAQDKKRLVVLAYLRDRCFPEDRAYPEKEVNQALALFNPDVAALRRYLIDAKLMTRDAGVYRRA